MRAETGFELLAQIWTYPGRRLPDAVQWYKRLAAASILVYLLILLPAVTRSAVESLGVRVESAHTK